MIIRFFIMLMILFSIGEAKKIDIKAIGIPLADHYASIIALEKYGQEMKYANFSLKFLAGPELVRAYFYSESDADIAFNVSPMVLDMYAQKQYFKLVSLIHRDGNALVVNSVIADKLDLNKDLTKRKPSENLITFLKDYKNKNGKPVICAIPSMLSTHTVILYKYLKDNKINMMKNSNREDLRVKIVKPLKSPVFLKKKTILKEPAMFEQSLPWPQLAQVKNNSQVAWYSKDILKHKFGHIECVIIAKNKTIKEKYRALKEVIYYIHKAGRDIETARYKKGKDLEDIVTMIQKYIPSHTKEGILQSLRTDINAINYKNLNIDSNAKESLEQIMNLAFEAGFIKQKVNLDNLCDESFSTNITKDEQ